MKETTASNIIKNIQKKALSVSNGSGNWEKYFDFFTRRKQGYIVELIKNTDDLSKLTGKDLVDANKAARQSAIDHNNALKQQTLGAKASKVALQGISMVGNALVSMGISLAINAVITGITKLANAGKEAAEKAREIGAEFKNTKSEITDYKQKISDLYGTINNSKSSIYDVAEARKSLMSVQNELIDKFGDEEGAINKITEAVNGQIDSLDKLTKKKWIEAKNKFNDVGFWGGLSNQLMGYTNQMDRMNDVMTGQSAQGALGKGFQSWWGNFDLWETFIKRNPMVSFWDSLLKRPDNWIKGNFTSFINDINAEISKGVQVNLDGLTPKIGYGKSAHKYDALKEALEVAGYTENGGEIILTGKTLEEVYQQILEIQEITGDFEAPKDFLKSLDEEASKAKNNLDQYKDMWNETIFNDRIMKDKELTDKWKLINEAYAEYENAFVSGDEKAQKAAEENFAKTLSEATNGLKDQDVIDFFNDMYPDLQKAVAEWKFTVNFEANKDNFRKDLSDAVNSLDMNEDGYTSSEEILNFNWKTSSEEQKQAYQELKDIVKEYGFDDMEHLVSFLEAKEEIRSGQYYELVKRIGQKNVDNLSDEDLEIAYGIEGFSNYDDFQKKLTEKKKELSSFPNKIKTLWNSENFSDTKKQLAELAKESEITADDIKSLAKENDELASILEESGVSAQFAAKCFDKLCDGSNDLSYITDDVIALDKALNGMEESLQNAAKAKSRYDKAMEQDDYTMSIDELHEQMQQLESIFI